MWEKKFKVANTFVEICICLVKVDTVQIRVKIPISKTTGEISSKLELPEITFFGSPMHTDWGSQIGMYRHICVTLTEVDVESLSELTKDYIDNQIKKLRKAYRSTVPSNSKLKKTYRKLNDMLGKEDWKECTYKPEKD